MISESPPITADLPGQGDFDPFVRALANEPAPGDGEVVAWAHGVGLFTDYPASLPGAAAQLTAGSFGQLRTLFTGARAAADGQLLGALEVGRDDGPWSNPERLNLCISPN